MAIFVPDEQLALMYGLARPHQAEEQVRTCIGWPSPGGITSGPGPILRRTNTRGVSVVRFKAPHWAHPGFWLAITAERGEPTVNRAFPVKTHGFESKQLAVRERARLLREKNARRSASPEAPAQRLPRPGRTRARALPRMWKSVRTWSVTTSKTSRTPQVIACCSELRYATAHLAALRPRCLHRLARCAPAAASEPKIRTSRAR